MKCLHFFNRLDVKLSTLIALIVGVWCASFVMAMKRMEAERTKRYVELEIGRIDSDMEGQHNRILNDILLDHDVALRLLLKSLLEKHGLNGVELKTDDGKIYTLGSLPSGGAGANIFSGALEISMEGKAYGILKYSKDMSAFVKRAETPGAWIYLAVPLAFLVFYAIHLFIRKQVLAPIRSMMKFCASDGEIKGPGPLESKGLSIEVLQLLKNFLDMREVLDKNQKHQLQIASLIAIGESTAMVAHDVRKPLASMKALLTLLPTIQDNPAEVAKMIASVDRNISQTNTMLNDILEFSKDTSSLNSGDENPQGVIAAALTDALRNHPGSAIKITYAFGHRHLLRADGARIIRVLTNIIDNALDAMTPAGGTAEGEIRIETGEISIPAHDQSSRRSVFRISLSDSGPGIPDDILPTIFDPFITKGKDGGTGLGLAICHRIVCMHGGRIEARNGPRGAEFIVDLPLSDAASSTNEDELIHHSQELEVFRREEATRPEYGDSANAAEFMRINKERGRASYLLIVDDEPLFRESVRCLLGDIPQVKDHVKYIEVGSTEDALKILSQREFDYVISDIDLGKRRMNGYAFSRRVLEAYSSAWVVIHSNKRRAEMDEGIRQTKSKRFMGFLPKPMTQSELLQFLACKTFESTVPPAPASTPKKNVLVVNDDDCLLVSLKAMLRSDAVHVFACTNMDDALRQFEGNAIDLILSDINFGDGQPSGYDLLKALNDRKSAVPFYFVSGYSSAEEEPKARGSGAAGYFQLPVEEGSLRELLVEASSIPGPFCQS